MTAVQPHGARGEITSKSGGVAEWIVLDRDGQIRTIMSAPGGLRILAANRAAVWGVIHGELGVPYVVRYRTATLQPDR